MKGKGKRKRVTRPHPEDAATSPAPSPPPAATADSLSSSSSEDGIDLFTEPSDYYAPPAEPTYVEYTFTPPYPSPFSPTQPTSTITSPSTTQLPPLTLHLRLVGHNPLWGHHLWNAGRVLAQYLQTHHTRLVRGRRIWELGAGAGLPSLVAWACGARQVLVTDYPDADLVENLQHNVGMVQERAREWLGAGGLEGQEESYGEIRAEGYLWGRPVPTFQPSGSSNDGTHHADDNPTTTTTTDTPNPPQDETYDTLLLGDLLFNHSEHGQLIRSVQLGLARRESAVALVFFTPYRPWLLAEDLKFFDLAREAGLEVRRVGDQVLDQVMFEEDRGDEKLRRTCFRYELRWKREVGGGGEEV